MLPMIGHFFGPGGKGKLDRLVFFEYKLQTNKSASIPSVMLVFQLAKDKDIMAD